MSGYNKGLPWTESEDDYLREHYVTQSLAATARELGRTPESVRSRAHKLGLKGRTGARPEGHPWWAGKRRRQGP